MSTIFLNGDEYMVSFDDTFNTGKPKNVIDRSKIYYVGLQMKPGEILESAKQIFVSHIDSANGNYISGGVKISPLRDIFQYNSNCIQEAVIMQDSIVCGNYSEDYDQTFIVADKVALGDFYRITLDTIKYFDRTKHVNLLTNKCNLIHKCIELGDIDSVKYIFNNVEYGNLRKYMELFVFGAMRYEHYFIAKWLIDNFDFDVQSNDNFALLQAVYKNKNYRFADYLIKKGANSKAIGPVAKTKMAIARYFRYGSTEVW